MSSLIFATVIGALSCQKTEVKVEDNVKALSGIENNSKAKNVKPSFDLINGMVHIESDAQLVQYMNVFSEYNDIQLDMWEKELGFESLRHITNIAYEKAKNAINLEELYDIVQENSEFIKIEEFSGEKELAWVSDSKFFASIANSQGYFLTGMTANKIIGNYLASTDLENIFLLDNFTIDNVSTLLIDKVKVQIIKHPTRLKTGCGVSFEKIEISGNYRVITEGYIQAYVMYYNPYPNSTCIDGVQRTTGYKKILGIWFKNKSNLQQGGHGTLVYNFNNGGDVTVSVYHNYWAGDDYQDCEVHTRWRTLDGYPNTLTFYYSHYDVYGISSNVANPADTICGS